MEILDKDSKNDFVTAFQYTVKVVSYYFHVSLLETCKSQNQPGEVFCKKRCS